MEKKPDKGLKFRETKKIKTFGYYFALGMALLTLIGLWKSFNRWIILFTIIICIYHAVCALFFYRLLTPTYRFINFIGKIAGNFLTLVIFSVIYYVLFTPVALLIRLAGKDVIRNNSIIPQWNDIPASENDPERIKKLF